MSFRIRLIGLKGTQAKLARLAGRMPKAVAQRLNIAASIVRATTKSEFLSAAGTVVSGKRGPRLIGSRSPADRLGVLTGRLRSSIRIQAASAANLRATVGTNVFYGRIHELIGVGASKVKRPFLRPSLEQNRGRIVRLLQVRIDTLVRGAA